MNGLFTGLRAWWVTALIVAAGWGLVAAGFVLVGGLLMGLGCVFALVPRLLAAADEPQLGGLHLRTRRVDLWLYTVLVVNVVGATLMVTRDVNVLFVIVPDALLLVWGAALVVADKREASETTTS